MFTAVHHHHHSLFHKNSAIYFPATVLPAIVFVILISLAFACLLRSTKLVNAQLTNWWWWWVCYPYQWSNWIEGGWETWEALCECQTMPNNYQQNSPSFDGQSFSQPALCCANCECEWRRFCANIHVTRLLIEYLPSDGWGRRWCGLRTILTLDSRPESWNSDNDFQPGFKEFTVNIWGILCANMPDSGDSIWGGS